MLINDHFQNYKSYGFEIKKNFFKDAQKWIKQVEDTKKFGYDKTVMELGNNLFANVL